MQNTSSLPKVSIITPCYNGESYVHRFLDSLLTQDYEHVEFIFVNDGSTDSTEQIFESYRKPLESKGWTVQYIWQENQGQASALNAGLKIFSGDYLLWPDSDDILYPQHISKKVAYMEQHKDIGIAYCSYDNVSEDDLNTVIYVQRAPEHIDMFFTLMRMSSDIMWVPISPIVRTSAFLDVNPERDIYISSGGQNCQMQLPLTFKYPYGVISDILAAYVIRSNSHSRLPIDFLRKSIISCDIYINTIKRLPCSVYRKKYLMIYSVMIFTMIVIRHYRHNYISKFIKKILYIKRENKKIKIRLFGHEL